MLLHDLVEYLDDYLTTSQVRDYAGAWNGLQVAGRLEVRRLAAAVDASIDSCRTAAEREADLLLVHHGLFWNPSRPIVDRAYARLAPLFQAATAVYSSHLPLDVHPEVGNNAVLLRSLGLECAGEFAEHQGLLVGRYADTSMHRNALLTRVEESLGQPVRSTLFLGPEICHRVGVITGGGGSLIEQAHGAGIDFYITGEGAHQTFFDARELGLNVVYGGHYATETFGVKALAAHLCQRFGLTWEFLDFPSGL